MTTARDFGVYVHIPFCLRRCGYCDFNTYALPQPDAASTRRFVTALLREIDLAAEVLGERRQTSTVFFGGGTPTVLVPAQLAQVLAHLRETWPLAAGAEVTAESNPDTVTQADLETLAQAGFTRVSVGMQSAVPQVLRTLDRTHDPAQVPRVVGWARQAGLDTSVDLIYGTPGESLSDWRASLAAALDLGVNHLSAYALTVEPHTRMGVQIRRGALPAPDDDDLADKYLIADQTLAANGFDWYEISNWAQGGLTGPHACRHNLGYWRGQDWWGIGPGAHSHSVGAQGARRWWNLKHPREYVWKLDAGSLPMAGAEELTTGQVALEALMLGLRLSGGIAATGLDPERVASLTGRGLVQQRAGRVTLTPPGRLLADEVVRQLAG